MKPESLIVQRLRGWAAGRNLLLRTYRDPSWPYDTNFKRYEARVTAMDGFEALICYKSAVSDAVAAQGLLTKLETLGVAVGA